MYPKQLLNSLKKWNCFSFSKSSTPSSSSTLNRLPICCDGTTTLNDLPDALLIEILLLLPLKSAKQVMLVCKHWYALMSTPYFGNRFLQLNCTSTFLFSYVDNSSGSNIRKLFASTENKIFRSPSFPLTYPPHEPQAQTAAVVASCGDLLLCCDPDFVYHSAYYICNPLTKNWIQLPPTPLFPYPIVEMHIGFIFQGEGSDSKYAVVRLPVTHDLRHPGDLKFEIFTSDSAEWGEKLWTPKPREYRTPLLNRIGVPYNGMLFWVSTSGRSNKLVGVDPFNVAEPPRLTPLPSSPKFIQRLTVCRGILKLLETAVDSTVNDLSIRLWVLRDFGKNEWFLEHEVSFFGLQRFLEREISFFGLQPTNPVWDGDEFCVYPIAFDPNNGDIAFIMMGKRELVLYNVHNRRFHVIYDIRNMFPIHNVSVLVYVLPWHPTSLPSLPSVEKVS